MAPAAGFEKIREQLHRQMLSAVSHDLKTPLATIIGSLEIYGRMEGKLTKEKGDMLLNSALAEAYRLDNFITNILDMAKLEAGMVKTRTERCNLTHLLNDAIIRLGPRRSRCDITLDATGEVHLQADPMLVGRAAGLVLENAMKHAGKSPAIRVQYGCNGADCTIRVHDDGPGIPEGKEEIIFSKYARFAKADQQNAGTGLGLAICRQLLELMGGNVKAENHPDGGAVFTLQFPNQ